ncbi:hypothetical protein EKO27_g10600 [Xylaria grammica]|uniref:Uncharacterized protein n=1 Tax=Xylaria grammica TaxID=363999 RepID=A0A439CQS0_9PEZI|nr:hypothetical protein EKO27_g10600 [Xylaria grammica]
MSSTSSLWYAWDQYEQMAIFRRQELKGLSNQLLPRYFTAFFARGPARARPAPDDRLLLRGHRALLLRRPRAREGTGLSLAISHLAWAPAILPSVKAIEKDAKEKNVTQLDAWLRLHVWRSLTVDLGAWACCIIATVKLLA